MTTVPTRSWCATTGIRWKKCFSTSRADGRRRRRHERNRRASRDFGASNPGDGIALLVSSDVVVAAAAGADLLAGAADHHLGLSAELHFAERQLLCARRRHADRRGDPVGHPVPRPARLFDLVPRGDVGAQSRQPDDEPVEADRVPDLADDHEPDPACDRRDPDDAAGAVLLRFQFLRNRAAADRVLLQPDLHELVGRNFRVRPGAAQRPRRREYRLDLDVRPDAADGQRSANAPVAGPTPRPGGRGTRLPGASCATGRRSCLAHRCAQAFRAAPPCGRGTPRPPGTYPPGQAVASSRNLRSFTSSWPIAGVIVPRRAKPTSTPAASRKLVAYPVLPLRANDLRRRSAIAIVPLWIYSLRHYTQM